MSEPGPGADGLKFLPEWTLASLVNNLPRQPGAWDAYMRAAITVRQTDSIAAWSISGRFATFSVLGLSADAPVFEQRFARGMTWVIQFSRTEVRMSDLPFLPVPTAGHDIGAVTTLAEARILAPAREHGYELALLGTTVLPQRQTIVRGESGTWLFVDHVEDPTAAAYGGKLPIPAAEHARLVDLDRAGVSPDVVWMAHELPSSWREDEPLPPLVPAPAHLREKDQRLTQRLRFAIELFVKGAGATLALAAALPVGAAAAIASAGEGLDPVILGGVQHPTMPVVAWVLLAQWDWE